MDSLWEDISSCSSGEDHENACDSHAPSVTSLSGVYSDLSDFDFDVLEGETTQEGLTKSAERVSISIEEVGSSPEPDWTICDSSPSPELTTLDSVVDSQQQADTTTTQHVVGVRRKRTVPICVSKPYEVALQVLDVTPSETLTSSAKLITDDTTHRTNRESSPQKNEQTSPPLAVTYDQREFNSSDQYSSDAQWSAMSHEGPRQTEVTQTTAKCYSNSHMGASSSRAKETRKTAKQRKSSKRTKRRATDPYLAPDDLCKRPRLAESVWTTNSSGRSSKVDGKMCAHSALDDTLRLARCSTKSRVRSCLKEFGTSVGGEHFDVMRLHSWTTREELEEAVQDHMDFVVKLRRQQQENAGTYSAETALQQLRNLGVVISGSEGRPSHCS